MLWFKAFHIIFMVTWFAALFYMPRLFVYHSEINPAETVHYNRFCRMERKLFWIIATPGAALTLIFGLAMLHGFGVEYLKNNGWLHIKLTLVGLLVIYQLFLYRSLKQFQKQRNTHSARFYRVINEFPSLLLIVIVLLATLKPF